MNDNFLTIDLGKCDITELPINDPNKWLYDFLIKSEVKMSEKDLVDTNIVEVKPPTTPSSTIYYSKIILKDKK